MPTNLEQMIRQRARREETGGILVPLLEEFMRRPVNIEDEKDVKFLESLARKMRARETRRKESKEIYSPSDLGDCLRRVYLKRNFKRMEIGYRRSLRIDPNFYFLNGNFLHLKWQFAIFKLERWIANPELFAVYGYEVPIMSKWQDHGGTADVIVLVNEIPRVVDFKGLNVRSAMTAMRGEIPSEYVIQLTDYLVLWNSQRKLPFRIEEALLIVENKGGPDPRHPLALFEKRISLEDFKPEVQRRISELRRHERDGTVPDPECVSTSEIKYTGCPFSGYCKEEVRKIQRRRRRAESIDAQEPAVAVPARERNHRPGESASGRGDAPS